MVAVPSAPAALPVLRRYGRREWLLCVLGPDGFVYLRRSGGLMQAKDIPDKAMIEAVRACVEARCNYPMDAGWHGGRPGWGYTEGTARSHWANRSDIARLFPDMPEKVVLAKLRTLIKRGLIDGCACGCRGDFTLPVSIRSNADGFS